MDNNEHNNEAESLFATKRKQQQAEEAERKRLEELEQQKQQMAAEVKRLEELQAAQREQEAQRAALREQEAQLAAQQAQLAQQVQQVQQTQPAQQTQPPYAAAGMGTGSAGAKKSLDSKTILIALAVVGGIVALLFATGVLGGSSGGNTPDPDPVIMPDEPDPDPYGGGYVDDSNYLYFNGHGYEYIDLDMSWMDAREYCRERGGHLVTITSPEEQDFLASNFYDQKLWIGAFGSETGWRWVTNEEWYYENWVPGEPNGGDNGEEWCGCFWTDMQWNDLKDTDPGQRISAFICEYDDFTDYGDY